MNLYNPDIEGNFSYSKIDSTAFWHFCPERRGRSFSSLDSETPQNSLRSDISQVWSYQRFWPKCRQWSKMICNSTVQPHIPEAVWNECQFWKIQRIGWRMSNLIRCPRSSTQNVSFVYLSHHTPIWSVEITFARFRVVVLQLQELESMIKCLVMSCLHSYYVKKHSGAIVKYTKQDSISLFGGQVFQQTIGIPVHTNCASLLADLFLPS